jgi:acyl-CoA thioesterase-2
VPDLWIDLLACLDLESKPSDDSGVARFEGRNQQLEYHRLFGGQLLGQFIQAGRLVCPDKAVKSVHTVFAREGRADDPVSYEAIRRHEGRSFAAVTVIARQPSRGVLATSSICMHAVEDGPDRQDVAAVPPVLGQEHRLPLDLIPWETRAVVDLNATTPGPPDFEFWMRTPEVDPELAPPLAAYATDLTLIGTALRPMEGLGPARQRHAVHLGGHLPHAVVSPAIPHRRLAAASPAQPAAGARAQLRAGRRAHRGRNAGRVVRPGGAAPDRHLSLATTRTTFY